MIQTLLILTLEGLIMPNFHDLYNELQQAGSHFDI